MSSTIENGWLTKSPPANQKLGILKNASVRDIFRPRWRRRWFELKTGAFPNQFVLEYFTDESCKRQKGQINLDECEQVAAPLAVQDRHKFIFNLRTPNRVYFLAADSEGEMNKWVNCLCQVCGLKTVDDDAEMYTKPPGDENNQPEDTENHESDESSPSLSNHNSGPYIPISECWSGKPIPLNEKSECTTYDRFVFPPEVNWLTHPGKREGSDSDSVQSLAGSAPPRPPKKFSPSVISNTSNSTSIMTSPRSGNEILKTSSLPANNTRTVFPYDNTEEAQDSSSTCSSLHSPPGSATYSNIPENSPVYQNPMTGSNSNINPIAQLNPIPSPKGGDPPPPKVDRNLKPDLRKPVESPNQLHHHHYKQSSLSSPTNNFGNQHSSGSMTLPSTRKPLSCSSAGPVVGRFNKPENSFGRSWNQSSVPTPIRLGPTPVQIKSSQAGNNNNNNNNNSVHNNNNSSISSSRFGSSITTANTNTLPNTNRRRAGPTISPHDKKPIYPIETPELTYLQIDCKSEGEPKSLNPKGSTHKLKIHHQSGSLHNDDSGPVEYKLIDHVKTMALNQMRQDREKQLRTSKNT